MECGRGWLVGMDDGAWHVDCILRNASMDWLIWAADTGMLLKPDRIEREIQVRCDTWITSYRGGQHKKAMNDSKRAIVILSYGVS